MANNHTLLDITYKCGVNGYVLKDVFRRMMDKHLFLIAYGNLYANKGALTPGTDKTQTIDGMSEKRIDNLIQSLRDKNIQMDPSPTSVHPKEKRRNPTARSTKPERQARTGSNPNGIGELL